MQRDPLSMYILAIRQFFIQQLEAISSDLKQVWFADDAPSAVTFLLLDHNSDTTPMALKSHLLMKEENEESAN